MFKAAKQAFINWLPTRKGLFLLNTIKIKSCQSQLNLKCSRSLKYIRQTYYLHQICDIHFKFWVGLLLLLNLCQMAAVFRFCLQFKMKTLPLLIPIGKLLVNLLAIQSLNIKLYSKRSNGLILPAMFKNTSRKTRLLARRVLKLESGLSQTLKFHSLINVKSMLTV
jgi:hypothetical protein